MVQRKVLINKLGIQAVHVRTDKWLGNLKLKTSSQHHDGKNKTTDLKRKMKRSKSIKLSDIESLRSSSSPLKKTLALPGKPPPLNTSPTKKQSLIKSIDRSPNYMKSTSSSQARRESSQVSSQNLHRRNSTSSKNGSASGNRPAKTLARASSLKLVRTLTKAPSFKHVRAPTKRSSRVALCADMNVQRATCSSTMKDSKFPPYLELNHGGTESERTSVLKVCPYNYCSLNGHHHNPLPPLRCFLSARRRSMKIQKGLKLEAWSPLKTKPSGNGTVEIIKREEVEFDAPTSPLIKEGSLDFYIDIYAKGKGDDAEEKFSAECGSEEARPEQDEDKQVLESLSDGAAQSELDFDDNLEQESVSIDAELLKMNDGEEYMIPVYAPEVSFPISEAEDDLCDAIDMEWEEGQWSGSEADEAEISIRADDKSESNQSDLQLEHAVFSDDNFSNTSAEILANEVLDETFNEESRVIDNFAHDQVAPMEEDVFEVPETIQQDEAQADSIGVASIPNLTGMLHEEAIEDSQYGVVENSSNIDVKEEALDTKGSIHLPLVDELKDDCNEVTTTCDSTSQQEIFRDESGDGNEEEEAEEIELLVEIQNLDSSLVYHENDQNENHVDEKQVPDIAEERSQEFAEDNLSTNCYTNLSDDRNENKNASESQSHANELNLQKAPSAENKVEAESMVVKGNVGSETFVTANNKATQELPDPGSHRWTTRRNKCHEDCQEQRNFNPQAPNFLPLAPEPDAEKVDLRHQIMDDKKNAEEWMLDYALRQAVTKLGPAKKRKVALLVEAFETVMPIPKFESQLRHTSAACAHGRPIQACS